MKEIKTIISKNYNRLKPRVTSLTFSDDHVVKHLIVEIKGDLQISFHATNSYGCDMNANQIISTAVLTLDQITTRDFRAYSTFS